MCKIEGDEWRADEEDVHMLCVKGERKMDLV